MVRKHRAVLFRSFIVSLFLLCGLSISFILCQVRNNVKKDLLYYYCQGIDAYKRQDYSKYLYNFKKAIDDAPYNPDLMFHLARGYALQGNKKDSIEWLEKCVSLGYYFNDHQNYLAKTELSDLSSIKNTDQFRALLNRIKKLNIPINNSELAFKIPEKDLMPEGIAYDPVEQIFYIGSGYKRKIISIDTKGAIKNFTAEEQDGIWNVWGMKVDAKRRILWANSSPWYGMKGFKKNNYGFTGVFKYNLADKKLIKKYIIDERPILHEFNDLVINSRGDVFITDDLFGAVYKISQEKDELELFIKPDLFTYPNGITLSQDEKFLYIAHREGVSVINLNTKSYFSLSHPANISLCTIDGLYFFQNSLIAIQSGYRPPRVIRFFLNDSSLRVDSAKIIESNNPLFNLPTTGVIVDNKFYYIANSQLNCYTEENKIFPLDKLHYIFILKTKL